jgi:hypothetical protein
VWAKEPTRSWLSLKEARRSIEIEASHLEVNVGDITRFDNTYSPERNSRRVEPSHSV